MKIEAIPHPHVLDYDQAIRLASFIWGCMELKPPPWWSAATDGERLRAAIRKLYDQRGDDRCWLDLEELFAAAGLPVKRTDFALHTPEEMLANCRKFIASMQPDGAKYVSPQREIERLQQEHASLVSVIEYLWQHAEPSVRDTNIRDQVACVLSSATNAPRDKTPTSDTPSRPVT